MNVLPNPGYGRRSPIERDTELAAFIRLQLGKVTLKELATCCREKFGPNRAPSKSSLHRYWCRLTGKKPVSKVTLKTPFKSASKRHSRAS